MITDYASLKTSIAAFLHRSDMTSIIPEFIADAENRIYNELRCKQMETAYSGTMSSGVVAEPSGILEWQWLYLNTDPKRKLDRRDVEWIVYQFGSSTGKPYYFARNAGNLIFGPTPDSDYAFVGSYYKRLTALSDSNTNNWLTDEHPDLIRYAALAEAAPYLQDDERIAIWEGKYQTAKNRIEQLEKREKTSGSRLSTIRG